MEYIEPIIQTTINSFDMAYCIAVNILTYFGIKTVEEITSIKLTTWFKRIITLLSIVIVAAVYIATGADVKLIFNSAILAPVFWSWIGKPIINKIKISIQ